MRKLVLFDIDGTLVLTGGAGIRALSRAMEEVLGRAVALDDIPLAGRTDWSILIDSVRKAGREMDDALFVELRDRYVERLAEEIQHRGRGVKAVMPGIRELLDELDARPDVLVGLLTGNFEAGARIKLEHFDLWRYFPCGAFGGDAADRNALVPFAVQRARSCGLGEIAPADVLVVGDTPSDVACAHAADAIPVAVATGGFTVDQLRESGADIVFKDLSDTRAFIALLDR
jgi:phosphoglycolate phosphatase-like HAD superfamily hydrolase